MFQHHEDQGAGKTIPGQRSGKVSVRVSPNETENMARRVAKSVHLMERIQHERDSDLRRASTKSPESE